MVEGLRDSFIENDVIGNYAADTNILGSRAFRNVRKSRKKHRKKAKHKMRRTKRYRKRTKSNKLHRKSRGGIKYTKNGQPYKIMPNGRARFIKK